MNRSALFLSITFPCWLLLGCTTIFKHTATLKHEPVLDDGNQSGQIELKDVPPEILKQKFGLTELPDYSCVATLTLKPSSFKSKLEMDQQIKESEALLKTAINADVLQKHPGYHNVIVTLEYLNTANAPGNQRLVILRYQLRVFAKTGQKVPSIRFQTV